MDKYTGKKLDGRYEIHELVGVGGMAFVYRAYDTIDDRTVAIKILKDEFLGNEEFIRRFKNESKAIAILSHPNIVKVYDVSFGDRIQYIVMEYIDGITLKEYIDQQHDIKWKEAVHFTVQILRALQHAHEKGIVHRDIKPQNIMLLPDGTIKVTDFGIARFSRSETRTMTDKAIGSVHYIAPEQARGDYTDEKADIYSVGVMLYEMLTGQLPFEADNAVSVAIMQLQSDPRPPKDINPAIPDGLEEITLKAMQKDPAQRYQSAADMLRDIEQFRRNPSIRFQYKYFIDEKPTKYVDAINNVKKPVTGPVSYDDGYNYEVEETAKTKSSAVPIIGGIAVAFLLFAIVFGMIALFRSCQDDGPKDVDLPNFVGQKYEDILKQASEGVYQFQFEPSFAWDSTKAEGVVLAQDPKSTSESGKLVKENSNVKLTINRQGDTIPVPDVTGLSEQEAIDRLKQEGFQNYQVIEVFDEETAEGYVVETNPMKETEAVPDTEISIMVSKGPQEEDVTIPPIIGLTLEQARQTLEAAGLKLGTQTPQASDKAEGTVLDCDPPLNTKVPKDTMVNVTVSDGKGIERTKEIFIELPADVSYSLSLTITLEDGSIVEEKKVMPSNGYYTFRPTGTGVKRYIVYLDGQRYHVYEVDFTQEGQAGVTPIEQNPFVPETPSEPPASSSPSSSEESDPSGESPEDQED